MGLGILDLNWRVLRDLGLGLGFILVWWGGEGLGFDFGFIGMGLLFWDFRLDFIIENWGSSDLAIMRFWNSLEWDWWFLYFKKFYEKKSKNRAKYEIKIIS